MSTNIIEMSNQSNSGTYVYKPDQSTFEPGLSRDEVTRIYNEWAKDGKFEETYRPEIYRGPSALAKCVSSYYPETLRRSVKILDIGAGGGNVALHLQKLGFHLMDALEPAQDALNIAKQKNLYTKYICDNLRTNNEDITEDTYDAVVTCGAMGEGHIPCSGLREMIRITKPGGLICIAMREEYLYHATEYIDRLEPLMKRLEEAGIWRRKERSLVTNFYKNKVGVIFIHEVLIDGDAPGDHFD